MIIDLTALAAPIELAAAKATVAEWREDAIWAAPSARGAVLRASLCFMEGVSPAVVADALDRFNDSVSA